MSERVFLALGSNLASHAGSSRRTLDAAIDAIGALKGVRVVRSSAPLITAPVSPIRQPDFLNLACELGLDPERATVAGPQMLLADLLDVELRFGRDRRTDQRWGPRTLDIDLILFGDRVLEAPRSGPLPALTLPHPRFRERAFVLRPLAEIAPEFRVPPDGVSIAELLERCERTEGAKA